MEAQRFDRLTTGLATGSNRRRIIASIATGTAMVFGKSMDTSARRRRRCTFCPQRACCSCRNALGPTKCSLIEASSRTDILNACDGFCGADVRDVVNFAVPESANTCSANLTCNVRSCPIGA
jgi:hypothetical protein